MTLLSRFLESQSSRYRRCNCIRRSHRCAGEWRPLVTRRRTRTAHGARTQVSDCPRLRSYRPARVIGDDYHASFVT